MLILGLGMMLAWAVCIAMFAAYAGMAMRDITYVTLADGRKSERRLPAVIRLLLPLAPNLRAFVSRNLFTRQREVANTMIVSAGLEGLISAQEFLALKFLIPLVVGGLWVMLVLGLAAMMPESIIASMAVPLCVCGVLYFYMYPLMWLRRTLRVRHQEITRALPFVLDLLTLSVEAGMDFMSALQRNCQSRKLDALNEELIRMTHEIQVGLPRRVALANMSERVRQSDLKSVTTALIQADELGVSIGSILRIQSEQLRSRRFERAEKLANEAPVKMLGPLMLCIFPAVFVVLLGPILSQALKSIF